MLHIAGGILIAMLIIGGFLEGLSYLQQPDALPKTGMTLMGMSLAAALYCFF